MDPGDAARGPRRRHGGFRRRRGDHDGGHPGRGGPSRVPGRRRAAARNRSQGPPQRRLAVRPGPGSLLAGAHGGADAARPRRRRRGHRGTGRLGVRQRRAGGIADAEPDPLERDPAGFHRRLRGVVLHRRGRRRRRYRDGQPRPGAGHTGDDSDLPHEPGLHDRRGLHGGSRERGVRRERHLEDVHRRGRRRRGRRRRRQRATRLRHAAFGHRRRRQHHRDGEHHGQRRDGQHAPGGGERDPEPDGHGRVGVQLPIPGGHVQRRGQRYAELRGCEGTTARRCRRRG